MKKRLVSLALILAVCAALCVPVSAAANFGTAKISVTLTSGYEVAAVIDSNNDLWMWGLKDYGILGTGETRDYEDNTQRYQQMPIKVLENVYSVSISASETAPFAAAIKTDGSLWMWGDNSSGQLGNGGTGNSYKSAHGDDTIVQSIPVKVMDNVVAVSCSNSHTAAIQADGSLWVWGANGAGQVGNGTFGGAQKTPVKVMDAVTAASCGYGNTAAVKTDGTLWMWGSTRNNAMNNGGIGNVTGSTTLQTVPQKVMDGATAVYFGPDSPPMVLKTDGTLVTWPENAGYAEVDQGIYASDYVPIKPTEPMPLQTIAQDVVSVSAGEYYPLSGNTVAYVKKDGSLWVYGENRYCQLGNPAVANKATASYSEPVKVMDNAVAVSVCGYTNVAAIKADGSFWIWGLSGNLMGGLIGDGDYLRKLSGFGGSFTEKCQLNPLQITSITAKVPTNESIPVPSISGVGGFADVKSTDYFADAVLWAVEKNITSGTSATTFSPNATCSKAQILTFLWRAGGSPEPTGANPFTDIKPTDYYYKAALWAAENGLVSGSTFGANVDCTRAMTVEYLWKAAGSPTPSGKASFTDVSTNTDYAQAVAWAVEKGITSGTSKTTFSPTATCTRGQIATFLYRALKF